MKITLFEVEPWEREAFAELESDHELIFVEEPLTPEKAAAHADSRVISVFISSRIGAEVLEQLSDLQLIATRSTGFDHIDAEYCETHDITIASVPTYGDNTVAEHVFALLLAISHRLIDAVDRTRHGDFTHKGLRGFDLRGKTIGIVGTGSIGEHTIRIAEGFGMHVIAFDVVTRDELAAELGFDYVPMETLLAESDIISLHVPLNDKTRHMIDAEAFAQMKDGVVLINTARGSIVDVEALLAALNEGKVAAAGLDVLPAEPSIREESELLRSVHEKKHLEELVADHALFRMKNVIVTPHNAFNTEEAVRRILETTVANIETFVRGQPQNVVVGETAP